MTRKRNALYWVVLRYLKDGMSASPSQAYDLIPEEVANECFSNSNRSARTGRVCGSIYKLMRDGYIREERGRYYVTQKYHDEKKLIDPQEPAKPYQPVKPAIIGNGKIAKKVWPRKGLFLQGETV